MGFIVTGKAASLPLMQVRSRAFGVVVSMGVLASCGDAAKTPPLLPLQPASIAKATSSESASKELSQPAPPISEKLAPPPWVPRECDGKAVVCVDAAATGPELGTEEAPMHTVGLALATTKAVTTILVASGTYRESVVLRDRTVELYGGFPGAGDYTYRDLDRHKTTLKPSAAASVIAIFNAGGSVIDGFSITGGTGHCSEWYCEGGGVYIASGKEPVSISHCEITRNTVEHEGHNTARGGGVAARGKAVLKANYIHHNEAERGAGVTGEGVTLIDNRIEYNIGHGDHGGGVALFGAKNVLIGNRIIGNELGKTLGYGWGGGVLIASPGTTFVSRGNVVSGNYAASGGSGVFIDDGATGTMQNDQIVANKCGEKGAAGLVVDALDESGDTGSIVDVVNVTIADNKCDSGTGIGNAIWAQGKGTVVRVRNSILWNNGPSLFNLNQAAAVTIDFTLTQDDVEGEGNFSEDPQFIAADRLDYRLRSGAGGGVHSPAIDRADLKSAFELEPTPNGGRANLGAFGNTGGAALSR